jgi:hypothetical protein
MGIGDPPSGIASDSSTVSLSSRFGMEVGIVAYPYYFVKGSLL